MFMNNLTLAYLGDAVYELYVRDTLIKKGITKVNDLQKEAIKYVSASSQRRIMEELQNKNVFTEEEINIYNRGRNMVSHKSKNNDVVTYHKSTGFECLIGYLYINNQNRLKEIMEMIL